MKYILFTLISVFLFNISYAHNTRFAGMGNLSLIFQDDFYKLDLYDFARMPAGFLRNDSYSSFAMRASGLKERWQIDSLTYLAIGQAIPQRLIDYAPVEAIEYYELIPHFPQFPLVPCEMIYISRRLEASYDDFGNVSAPQAWGVYAGYSQLSRKYIDDDSSDVIRTPELYFIYSKQVSENLDLGMSGYGFYGVYNSADRETKATLMPFGGSIGVSHNSRSISLGVNGEYHYPIFNYSFTRYGNEYAEKYSGHAISPSFGFSMKFANITWIGAIDYKWVSLGGSLDGEDIGDLDINAYSAKSQILFAPAFVRVTAFVQHDSKKPIYTDENDNLWFETSYTNNIFGTGVGVALKRVTAGIESFYKHNVADDRMTEETLKGSDFSIKFGAEFNFVKNLFIRGGYNSNQIDPDLDEGNDLTMINTLTAGLGFNVLKKTRIDIAYNYKSATTNLDPDEKITDHIIYLYFKYTKGW